MLDSCDFVFLELLFRFSYRFTLSLCITFCGCGDYGTGSPQGAGLVNGTSATICSHTSVSMWCCVSRDCEFGIIKDGIIKGSLMNFLDIIVLGIIQAVDVALTMLKYFCINHGVRRLFFILKSYTR